MRRSPVFHGHKEIVPIREQVWVISLPEDPGGRGPSGRMVGCIRVLFGSLLAAAAVGGSRVCESTIDDPVANRGRTLRPSAGGHRSNGTSDGAATGHSVR